MVDTPLRFGAFAPQGWKLEYTGWDSAAAWDRTVELTELAEQLSYNHLWVYDHVETVPRREPTHMFEAFTMLAALLVVLARRLAASYAAYAGAAVLLALTASNLDSFERYAMSTFPLVIGVALITKRPTMERTGLVLASGGLVAYATVAFCGRYVP